MSDEHASLTAKEWNTPSQINMQPTNQSFDSFCLIRG